MDVAADGEVCDLVLFLKIFFGDGLVKCDLKVAVSDVTGTVAGVDKEVVMSPWSDEDDLRFPELIVGDALIDSV